jgi:plasmid stability protein
MQNAYMAKTATVTVRIPELLKEGLEARALREHRSLSAQIEHELTRILAGERAPGPAKAGTLLGRFSGKKVPTDADVREVRAALWKRLERAR